MRILLTISALCVFASFVQAQVISAPKDVTETQSAPSAKVNGGVLNGKATSLPKPAFSRAAQAVGAKGAVTVQVLISEDGSVLSAMAVSGHPMLRLDSESAARAARFSPTLLSGLPVRVSGVIVYNFVPSTPSVDHVERLKIMGMGAMLAYSRSVPLDAEWELIRDDMMPDMAYLVEELAPLKTIGRTTSAPQRVSTLDEVAAAVGRKLSGAERWEFTAGQNFGELLERVKPTVGENTRTIEAIEAALRKLGESLEGVPPNFPADVLDKLKIIAEFAKSGNLSDEQERSRLVSSISRLLDVISPGR